MPILPFILPVAVGAGIYLLRKQREYAWGKCIRNKFISLKVCLHFQF